jgi:hypothetical protein
MENRPLKSILAVSAFMLCIGFLLSTNWNQISMQEIFSNAITVLVILLSHLNFYLFVVKTSK